MANCIFYVWGGLGAFIFLCLFSLLVFAFAKILEKQKKKWILGIFVAITAIPLIIIKYTTFAITNINSFFNLSLNIPSIFMPIGISFFTFEAISLFADTYKGKINGKISLFNVYLYLSFFPTVTSGPIMRYNDFEGGLSNEITNVNYSDSIERIVIGLCKKVLIADKVALLADYYFDNLKNGISLSSFGLWLGAIAYTLQIYFDFSGYSDMAIGMGGLLGFNIPENFNKPYRAVSISDFWRRWHISLSEWFRDYVYIPLGGNRCSKLRHIFNMLVVWLLTGIWHGADWSFIVWGLGFFLLLVAEKYLPFMKKLSTKWYGRIYTLFFVNLLWIPFRASNLSVTGKYILGLFGIVSSFEIEKIALKFLPYIALAIILCTPIEKLFEKFKDKKWFVLVKGIVLLALVFLAVCSVINASYTPYIYGNF